MNLEPLRVGHIGLWIGADTEITVRAPYAEAEPVLFLGEVPVRAGGAVGIRDLGARIAAAVTSFEAQGILQPEPAA